MKLRWIPMSCLLALASCSTPTPLLESPPAKEAPEPFDPNEGVVAAGASGSTGADEESSAPQHSARTTLLEENEHLRDLLSDALAQRREVEQRLGDCDGKLRSAVSEASKLRDSVAQLSEQLEAREREVAELTETKGRLEQGRSTLAEMYALEKRQRLAFEKELLEREIKNRTLSRDG